MAQKERHPSAASGESRRNGCGVTMASIMDDRRAGRGDLLPSRAYICRLASAAAGGADTPLIRDEGGGVLDSACGRAQGRCGHFPMAEDGLTWMPGLQQGLTLASGSCTAP
jgi:hypothetical protein